MILPFAAPVARIVVHPGQVLGPVSNAMFGACLEDVNHEVYGGLYAQRIFGESFEEPAPGTSPSGWKEFGGEWTPSGPGVAHVRASDGPILYCDKPITDDSTIEASLRLPNDLGENAGLLVRVSKPGIGADNFDGYEISLSAKTRTLLLGKHLHDFKSITAVAVPIEPGQWHRLKVALSGPSIQVFLDRETKPRIDFTDPNPLSHGSFALRSWRADAEFKDVRVDQAQLPISFAGSGVSRMWDRVLSGTGQGRFYVEEGASNGQLCQKIEYLKGQGSIGIANRGLNRWGISVRAGHPMTGHLFVKGDIRSAWVSLQCADGSRTYARQKISVGPNWAKAAFTLNPTVTDPAARFVVSIDHPGSLTVDEVVLMDAPQNRFQGLPVRRDIADAMIASGLNFLRYGGTMVNVPGYRWKDMIGDPDRRPPYAGNWYSCSTHGFGIFDFLNFCEKANFGSAFAINSDETPQDAADLADYLSAPISTYWGQRRAADGHLAPYHPTYIEIGNEEAIGNPDGPAMARYASKFTAIAKAIHGRNPNLKLVCAAWWVPDAPQMKTVFDAVDGQAAAWDLHFWCDELDAGANVDRELGCARNLFRLWNPKTTLKTVVFEENGNRHDFQRALGHALTIDATRRNADFVLADCAANALQPWRQNDNGWDQGQIFFTPEIAWPMPPAIAQQLLSRDQLPLHIAATAEGGLDVYASRAEDGKSIDLTVVNPASEPKSSSIDPGRFKVNNWKGWTVTGSLSDVNRPGSVRWPGLTQLPGSMSLRALRLPERSITLLRFRK